MLAYFLEASPTACGVVFPDEALAEAFSTDRLAPMLRESQALVEAFARSDHSRDTLTHKTLGAASVTICWASSGRSLRSRAWEIALCDEIDAYPKSAGSDGDPLDLIDQRTKTYESTRTVGRFSTPTDLSTSRIWPLLEAGGFERFFVPCPACSHSQFLEWRGVQWPSGHPERAQYQCIACGEFWDDRARIDALKRGGFRATCERSRPRSRGFHLPELCSPWLRLGEMASQFAEVHASGDPERLKVFTNSRLAEPWKPKGAKAPELADRREAYPAEVPRAAVLLIGTVDVQDDRLEYEVVGLGVDGQSWGIEVGAFYGDPSNLGERGPWVGIDGLLSRGWKHESGVELHVAAIGVDTGGHHTQSAYAYARDRESRRVYALKGRGGQGEPLVRRPTRNNKAGVALFVFGADTAKDLAIARLAMPPGPGRQHFPETYSEETLKQLQAEERRTKYVRGYPRTEWVKVAPRNELLDLRSMQEAVREILNPNLREIERRLEARIERWVRGKGEATEDPLPDAQQAAESRAASARRSKMRHAARGRGFVGRY